MPTRPLSPHLGVYKFMYTMALSILHRITGLALAAGFLLFVWWLMALATGAAAYRGAVALLSTPFVKLVLLACTFAFAYHLCNGIRHLRWDIGRGLERQEARRSGVITVMAALLLTAALVWLGCQALAVTASAAPVGVVP